MHINIVQKIVAETDDRDPKTVIKLAKKHLLITHLNNIGIQTSEQKRLLISILIEKCNSTKIEKIWFIGVFALLALPIWNSIIVANVQKHIIRGDLLEYIGSVTLLIIMIIIGVGIIRYIFVNPMLSILNSKSNRYKEIYSIIQENLLAENVNNLGEHINKKLENPIFTCSKCVVNEHEEQ